MITVIDAPCGTGKTTYCIEYMKNNSDKRFIYITPFLSECERVRKSVPNMYEPKRTDSGKYKNFLELLEQGKNIVSTHALFQMCTPEMIDYIKLYGYILILDEVMNVVEQLPVKKDDIPNLLNAGLIEIKEDGKIVWLKEDNVSSYDDFKIKCLNESLYLIDGVVLFWVFPVGIFEAFNQVFICTYMYDAQIQRYYYDYFNIKYEKKTLKENKLVEYEHQVSHLNKIHICDNPNINFIGDTKTALSKHWYQEKVKTGVKLLKKSTYNYFRNIVKAKSKDIIWTTFKDYRQKISGEGYTKAFVPCNTRATNEYINKHYVAYLINCYLNPYEVKFFSARNITINQDLYALSELIQFIYRSAVRNGEDIYVYIPSNRMRGLLQNYIGNVSTFV